MIRFRPVQLGVGGAAECRLCGGREAPSRRDAVAVAEEFSVLADEWNAAPGPNVLLCGCEPFSHPDLPEIVGAAVAAGTERIGLLTDAIALGEADNASGAIASGVRYVEAILLAPNAAEHDRLSGIPGSFDAAVAGMEALVHAASVAEEKVALVGRVVVCPHTLKSLPEITLVFAKASASAVRYVVRKELCASRLEWVFAALDTAVVSRMWGWVDGVSLELLGDRALHAEAAVVVEGGASS